MSTLALTELTNAAKSKTWSYNVNQASAYGTANEGISAFLYFLKVNLLTMSGAVVKGSSNGTTAAMDGVDRVTSDPAALTSGSPLKWIVIDMPNMSGGFEWLISWHATAGSRLQVSPAAGFTGGSTSAIPTATDSYSSFSPSLSSPTVGNLYNHFCKTSDGKSFIWFCTGGNVIHSFALALEGVLACETANSLDTTWVGSTVNSLTLAFPTTWQCRMSGANAVGIPYGGPFIAATADKKTAQGDLYIASEFGISDNTTTPDGIWFQKVFDLYRGGNSLVITGDSAPAGGPRDWLQLGNMVIPWSGADLTIL